MANRWDTGTVVLWRSVQDGLVTEAQPRRVVRDEHDLVALYLCPGTRWQKRKGRPGGPRGRQIMPGSWTEAFDDVAWTRNHLLSLYRPGSAHSVGLFWGAADGAFIGWHVNLEAPWRRTSIGFDSRDHILDLIVAPDLSAWQWKDADEFAWAQEIGLIAPAEAAAIQAEAERAIGAIERRASPYSDGWEQWMPDPRWTIPALPPDGWMSTNLTRLAH